VLNPLILCCNRQIEACLVLRSKPRNHHGDFEAQIIKSELPVLRSKLGNPKPLVLMPNREKPSPPVLRPNWRKLSPLVLRSNWRKPSHWFWGQTTNKPSTLVLRLNYETRASRLYVYGADLTQHHPASRSLATEYPTCAITPGPLHQVFYSCHNPHHYMLCRTYHLHKQTRFSKWTKG
jgi:hypothetical protein